MYSKQFYMVQLEELESIQDVCEDKSTLKKVNRAIDKYKSIIGGYDTRKQTEECHCQLCIMQG
jgi:hypothetical protein